MIKEKSILLLRISYWLGALLDLVSFFQMIFPEKAAMMMGAAIEIEPGYIFGMQLGSSLMLAWTVLLIWADRKPVERRDVLLITLIVNVMNAWVLISAIENDLLPLNRIFPQLCLMAVLLGLYIFSYFYSRQQDKENKLFTCINKQFS